MSLANSIGVTCAWGERRARSEEERTAAWQREMRGRSEDWDERNGQMTTGEEPKVVERGMKEERKRREIARWIGECCDEQSEKRDMWIIAEVWKTKTKNIKLFFRNIFIRAADMKNIVNNIFSKYIVMLRIDIPNIVKNGRFYLWLPITTWM